MAKPKPKSVAPLPPRPEFAMHAMVITVTRSSATFVAGMREIPSNAIIRMEGQHWSSRSRI